jgi:hypothetical protein
MRVMPIAVAAWFEICAARGKSYAAGLLGLWLLGSAVAAFAAPPAAAVRSDPDACRLLSNNDLEPLLFDGAGGTLDSWSGHPVPGTSTCRWEARLSGASPSAAPRVTTLAFYHFADRGTAQARLAAQSPGAETSSPSLAIDGKSDDALVRVSATVVIARHDTTVAALDAQGAELSHPEQMEVRYLLDSLALKAAGASVRPPPWAKPGESADEAALTNASAANWIPPANSQAVSSAAGQWLLCILIFVFRHNFLILFGGIFGSIAIGAFFQRGATPSAQPAGLRPTFVLAPIGIVALGLNMFFGSGWADRLLHHYGTAAAATITDSYGTSTQYNNHDVMGYHVLIRTPGGKTVATHFEDDDFNVYPPHNETRYPGEGDIFTVRYLSRFPGDFVIISDDDSPWAHAGRCAELRRTRDAAVNRARFSGNAADLAAVAGTGAADCASATDSSDD